jgi:hypothetical protein
MKLRTLALLLVAVLPLMAFDCVNDAFTISLNLKPFNGTYAITPGPTLTFGGSFSVNPSTLYDQGYTITGASVYDIKVSTAGPDRGTCSGSVAVNGIPLFTYTGPWTGFNTPQSLLTSRYITRNSLGIAELISCVVNKKNAVFTTVGSVTVGPVPAGCSLTVSAHVQAWGHL